MEVSNHERKFLKFFAGGLFLIILLAVPTGRWVHDFLWEKQPEWANVDGVIPAVQHYDFDSTGWNIISEADYILDPAMGPESYRIVSSPNGIMVTHGDLGDYRAQATLSQLGLLSQEIVAIPYGTIADAPAFKHRGVLLDVARHFFKVPEIKRQLDVMALYKFNVFHWHLTEDQGWRIAIEAYPKLSEVGGWRAYGDSLYGGYYTKEELVEVVNYASGLGIEVIPEIEMPGHSQAAIAAYPELGCTGEPVEVATDWGVFKDIYCAGNEQTFDFLEAVLDEVCEIFPAKYIHIGGDEAPKFRWEHCAKCQARLETENLDNTAELQRYFITRIETYLHLKGKQIIGWDEILEGGLSPNATVQSWRGFEGAQHAAELGHDAIVSPTSHAYFDYPVGNIDLPKVYSFDPIPGDLDPLLSDHILGGECNLWSEHITDIETLDRRFLPRGIAMSEVLWAYPEERDYESFRARIQPHYVILDKTGYSFDVEQVPSRLESTVLPGTQFYPILLEVDIEPTMPDFELALKLDGQLVDTLPKLSRGFHKITSQPMKSGLSFGAPQVYSFAVHEGLLTHSCMTSVPSPFYKGSTAIPLSDGRLGSLNFRDGEWLGYYGPEGLDGHWNFSSAIEIDSIKVNFLQSSLSWIVIPETVYLDFYVQSDVLHRYEWNRTSLLSQEGTFIETMMIFPTEDPVTTLDIEIPNTETLPSSHPAAGQHVWHFIDEIQIYGRPL